MSAVDVSEHAVARYHEPVRPGLSLEQAEEELLALLETHARWGESPAWRRDDPAYADADWVLLDESIAFPCERGVLVTCLVRAGYRPVERKAVNRHRRRSAQRAAGRRLRSKWDGREAKANLKRGRRWEAE